MVFGNPYPSRQWLAQVTLPDNLPRVRVKRQEITTRFRRVDSTILDRRGKQEVTVAVPCSKITPPHLAQRSGLLNLWRLGDRAALPHEVDGALAATR